MDADPEQTIGTVHLEVAVFAMRWGQAVIIDVRTPSEFRELSVPGSVNLPIEQLAASELPVLISRDTRMSIYILCRSGRRAEEAARILVRRGVSGAKVIEGGILKWKESPFTE